MAGPSRPTYDARTSNGASTLRLPAALALALLASAPASIAAQTDTAEPEGWQYTFTPYFWAASLKGTIGVGANTAEVDVSFSDIFSDFNLGFMGLFEARRHPWALRADALYISLSDEVVAGPGQTVTVGQDEFMLQPEVGYTILTRPWGGVDALVGARYWHLSVDIDAPAQEVSGDKGWVDGTVGANLRYQPAEKWHLAAKADIGAGGSDLTWQIYGGAGYDLGRCCALVAAYRHLEVDYDKEGFLYDVYLSGPALGVTLRF
jgi:hypothetical protein